MLLTPLTDSDSTPNRARSKRAPGRIVWQERYDGVAMVAHHGGKAVACISGPWSDRYVLTWWECSDTAPQLELFDSLDAARLAVELCVRQERQIGDPLVTPSNRREGFCMRTLRAIGRFFSRRRKRNRIGSARSMDELRRRHFGESTDLSGLHFRAFR